MKQGTMSITHESMMALTAHMPMKTIEINGDPYLERYFAHMLADGTQIWYHRFLRNDAERHLHTHPWFARSTILVGGYVEDRDVDGRVVRVGYSARDTNAIGFCTLHRIVEVEPDTWTMMVVSPGRQPHWHFVEEDGSRTEMPTSPFEWSKDFKPRAAAQPQVPEGIIKIERTFEYFSPVTTPKVVVYFAPDDWEARDRFALWLSAAKEEGK